MAPSKRDTRDGGEPDEERMGTEVDRPAMAVSIVGVSTACSKDALVSSAKAAKEALSTE
jgi:hypothetical protein